jgi:hypothetical protein
LVNNSDQISVESVFPSQLRNKSVRVCLPQNMQKASLGAESCGVKWAVNVLVSSRNVVCYMRGMCEGWLWEDACRRGPWLLTDTRKQCDQGHVYQRCIITQPSKVAQENFTLSPAIRPKDNSTWPFGYRVTCPVEIRNRLLIRSRVKGQDWSSYMWET